MSQFDARVDALMAELGEPESARALLCVVVANLSESAWDALIERVREIEAGGGIWSTSTRQRRTRGGVFFELMPRRVVSIACWHVNQRMPPKHAEARREHEIEMTYAMKREERAAPRSTPTMVPSAPAPASSAAGAPRVPGDGEGAEPEIIYLRRRTPARARRAR